MITNYTIPPTKPSEFMGFLLWKTFNQWETYVNQSLKPYHITHTECFYLISIFMLNKEHREVTQTMIATTLQISTMNTSKLLRKLEREGYIDRTKASDPRAYAITINNNGIEKINEIIMLLPQLNHEFFINHNDKDSAKNYFKSLISR